jgi:plasmid maintenance system antidote protein VapI
MQSGPPPITRGDLRAEAARHRIKLYELAAAIHLHPTSLSGLLNGEDHAPLAPELAKRILATIQSMAEGRTRARAMGLPP